MQVPVIQKAGYNEVAKPSSQNLEKTSYIDDMLSKLKKEPEDDYTPMENIVIETVEDINPVLNIKEEIMDDDDENAGLPVILSYGSVVTAPVWEPPVLTPQPIVVEKATPTLQPRKANIQNFAAVVKGISPSSQVVVHDPKTNKYKVVKCLSVNAGTYSDSQYKSYLPNTRISFQKP